MVAVPAALRVALPRLAVPSANVTLPVGVATPWDTVTVAVMASAWPAIPGFTAAASVVAVCAWFTTCVIAAEVLGPLFVSPW